VTDHDEMSHLITAQLELEGGGPPKKTSSDRLGIQVQEMDIQWGLDNSLQNTTAGGDLITYPTLRLWFRTCPKHITSTINDFINGGYPEG
jgi:hypothetical protein